MNNPVQYEPIDTEPHRCDGLLIYVKAIERPISGEMLAAATTTTFPLKSGEAAGAAYTSLLISGSRKAKALPISITLADI